MTHTQDPQPDSQQPDLQQATSNTTDAAQSAMDAAALQAQVQELQDQCLRAQAEVQNARRRADEEVQKARKFGIESFAESMLPVLDSLEAALAIPNGTADQLREGTDATLRQLQSALERNKVLAIAPQQGDKFDPNLHQAMFEVPGSEYPSGTVAQVVQPGYAMGERLLRPALVGVAKGPSAAEAQAAETAR